MYSVVSCELACLVSCSRKVRKRSRSRARRNLIYYYSVARKGVLSSWFFFGGGAIGTSYHSRGEENNKKHIINHQGSQFDLLLFRLMFRHPTMMATLLGIVCASSRQLLPSCIKHRTTMPLICSHNTTSRYSTRLYRRALCS